MKLTEARVGLAGIAIACVTGGATLWADVRQNTRHIAEVREHDARQDEERDEARTRIADFRAEYERKEQADTDVNDDVADHEARIRKLELMLARHEAAH